MARRRLDTPTECELEILEVLWERGPSTVREVLEVLVGAASAGLHIGDERHEHHGRQGAGDSKTAWAHAFIYSPKKPREKTLGAMVQSLLGRAFEGSVSSLVTQLLDQSKPTRGELDKIREAIANYENDGASK